MQRTPLVTFSLLSLVILLAACGSSSKTTTSPAPTSVSAAPTVPTGTTAPAKSAGGPAVLIENGGSGFRFVTTMAVKAGTRVTVKNTTAVQHTVTADTTAGGFDLTIDPGKTMSFAAPSEPGAYKFHCNIHNYMMGTLTVT